MREPRFVRRRVSGDTPTVNWEGVKEVMVRHVPGLANGLADEVCWDEGQCVDVRKDTETGRAISWRGMSWRTVYADAIAQMGICENLGAVGDCQ